MILLYVQQKQLHREEVEYSSAPMMLFVLGDHFLCYDADHRVSHVGAKDALKQLYARIVPSVMKTKQLASFHSTWHVLEG